MELRQVVQLGSTVEQAVQVDPLRKAFEVQVRWTVAEVQVAMRAEAELHWEQAVPLRK